MGSDGLLLSELKLYACYAPEVFDYDKVIDKFEGDLSKAIEKRGDQFETFVFVHNDLRGIHPAVSKAFPNFAAAHPDISLEIFGHRRFRDLLVTLSRESVEDILGRELPLKEMVYGAGIDELESLLDHLSELRVRQSDAAAIKPVSNRKLAYNDFSDEMRDDVRKAMIRSADIDHYYASRIDTTERDEVANAFRQEYFSIRETCDDSDQIVYYLEQFVMGNAHAPLKKRLATTAVISYFFQTCDIFEDAPDGWIENGERASA
jgi:hypothetical protein